jgi:hypothetical protein
MTDRAKRARIQYVRPLQKKMKELGAAQPLKASKALERLVADSQLVLAVDHQECCLRLQRLGPALFQAYRHKPLKY